MICRIVPAVLLSLSFSLTGCAVYDVDSPRYSASRYSSYGEQKTSYSLARSDYGYQQYGYQQPVYPVVRYREYQAPVYRYPQRVAPVYIYRQAPQRYWPAPEWRGRDDDHRNHRGDGYREREHDRRAYQRDQRQRYERREHYGDQRRGWEVRLN